MRKILFLLSIFIVLGSTANATEKLKQASPNIQLYTLNCGYIDIHDGYDFSDTEFYPHQPILFANPCFLIKHPNGWLLWDTGLGDKYLGHKFEDIKHGLTIDVQRSLTSQLKQLGLVPNDIKYVGLSHTHFDHVGNINLFQNSQFIIQSAEFQSLQKERLSNAQDISSIAILKSPKINKILPDGDYDVFKDGSVILLRTPGHTVGHQSLEVKLSRTGTVILTGDVYHTSKAYQFKQMPAFNANRADTLASMSRIDNILKNTHGRLIIQHDLNDFNSLPKLPQYLD